ncbi:MAG: ATP-binding protein [Bacteroidales bacterium]|nr:ATP-binding protein [Bacteroidales bacterium]
MDSLFIKSDRHIANTPTSIVRSEMQKINWSSRLICIQGAKGVGKSTLIKQFVKLNYSLGDRSVLYCSADSVYFSNHSLVDLASLFTINGGERLIIDEVHKYREWSREIKEIYDLYPELRIIISGSSLLQLLEGDADLSRRCVKYTMQGLSFREYLRFYHNISLDSHSLDEIISNAYSICSEVNAVCKPNKLFKEYLRIGYYPFYLEDKEDYYTKIEQVVNFIIETELPLICKVDISNIRKIKALVSVVSRSVPFEVDAKKLAGSIECSRDTVIEYLNDLANADVLNLLYSEKKNIGKLTKPDKIYLENPNLLYALSPAEIEIGTARETFAVCHLSESHNVEYGKTQGDFKVDFHYTFEIGGPSKDFSQIAGIPDSYIFADDTEYPEGAKLPLWLLGFLY